MPQTSTSNSRGVAATGVNSASNTVTVDAATTVTVKLLDSTGHGLMGGRVDYYSNSSWHAFGITGVDGSVSNMLLPDNYDFRMTYAYGQVGEWQNVRANPMVVFQTVNVAVELKDGLGNGISGGAVRYYGGSWHDIGTTGGTGTVRLELLATTYNFSMDYNNVHSEKSQNVGWSSDVIFPTTLFI